MAGGSQLVQLKAALSNAGVTRQPNPSKKRKRSQSSQQPNKDKKAAKLQEIHERLNPFDVKVTKLKHDVGGRKIKGVSGRPAKSKQTGLEQRQTTLLKELEQKNRMGGILDRRFGENDPTMTPEERMLERFTKERQRASRGAAFNLDDEDELTHYGQSLSKLDDFEGTGLALDDEDDDAPGQIDGRTVKSVHFGGFDDDEQADEDEGPARKKSKAEVMAEVIAKSKEHKALRQVAREEGDDLRRELDNELDSIRDILFAEDTPLLPLEAETLKSRSKAVAAADTDAAVPEPPRVTEKDQAFDQYVRELAFEQRAKPKDRTKTEEELATEEKVRLEKAERRRVRRMDGLPDYDSEEENAAPRAKRAKTRGGDDLEDDFDNEDEELGALGRGLAEEGAAAEDEEDEEEGSEDDGDEEDDEDPDEEDASDEEGSRDEDADSQSDFGEDADDPEAEAGDQEELVASKPGRRRALVRAPKELPFTFPCPQTHDEFLEIVEDVADSDVATVVQRIRALHHPSLAEDNQFKLQALAGVLIDHILYVASPPTPHFQVVSGLLPHLHALTHKYPSASAAHFIAKLVLMEKNLKRGLALGATASDAKTFPGLPELALMRTLGALWPTSDLTHAVVSPARLLMGAYLGLGRVRSVHDLASGLFLCTLWLQYEALSKRFVPEAVTFVANTVLHLAPHGFRRPADVPGSFPCPDLGSATCKSLRIASASTVSPSSPPDIVAILAGDAEGEQTKVDLLATAFELIGRFAELYKGLDGFPELFQPLADVLVGVRAAKLPASLQSRLASVSGTLSKLVANHLATRAPLALQAHKPIPIPTYVPKFSSSGGSSYLREKDPDVERAESAKLRRAYKQEKKGALRELRKDARFLAGVQQAAEREKSDAYEARMRRAHASIESERAEEKRDEKEKAKERKRAGKR